MDIRKLDPAVDKRFLILLSGLVWSIVGILLCRLALGWLSETDIKTGMLFGIASVILALSIHHFGFLKLVDKNIDRIQAKDGKVCIFAFQEWKSYAIIAVMVCMGIILRSSPLPKHYLSIIYVGFGGAMILSSIRYYRVFIKLVINLSAD